MALETLKENDYASGDGQSPAKQLRLVVNIHHPPAFAIVIQLDLRFEFAIPSQKVVIYHYSIIFAEFLKHQSVTTSALFQSMSFLDSLGVRGWCFSAVLPLFSRLSLENKWVIHAGSNFTVFIHTWSHARLEGMGFSRRKFFWISGGYRWKKVHLFLVLWDWEDVFLIFRSPGVVAQRWSVIWEL